METKAAVKVVLRGQPRFVLGIYIFCYHNNKAEVEVPVLIKAPYFKQPTVYACVPGSLKMLTAYYGINPTTQKIAEDLDCTPKTRGVFMEAAAEYLTRLIASPTLVFFDPELYSSWYQISSRTKIIEDLKDAVSYNTHKGRQEDANAMRQEKLMYFMLNGGKFLTRLSLTDLQGLIKSKRPVIASVELNHLYPDKDVPEDVVHTIVVIGYRKDKIIFLDPDSKGTHSCHEEHFVWSWYAQNGGALYI